MTWDDVAELITGTPPAHLATADADGHPHVSLVAPIVDGDDLVFFTSGSSAKARNLRDHPELALVFEGNAAETYVWGTAQVTDDVAAKQAVWDSGRLPYDPVGFFGSADNPAIVLVRITPTRASAMRQGPDGPGRSTWTA